MVVSAFRVAARSRVSNLCISSRRSNTYRSLSSCASVQAEAISDEKAETAAKIAERTMKRFWKRAGIKEEQDGCTVMLDHRNVRTPNRHVVKLPPNQRILALLTAAEWDSQTTALKQHTLPLTGIIARAMDSFDPVTTDDPKARPEVIDKMMTYFDTDAICYHEDFPEILTQLQDQHWKPLIDWAQKTYGIKINTTTGIFAVQQSQEAKDKLRSVVEGMDALELAAFEKAVMSSKSFLIGLALVKKAVSVEEAACAAHVEMNAQIDRWGEVEDSHDVEREYIRQTLGSVACVVMHK